jgi:hypothetical protein
MSYILVLRPDAPSPFDDESATLMRLTVDRLEDEIARGSVVFTADGSIAAEPRVVWQSGVRRFRPERREPRRYRYRPENRRDEPF